MIFFLFSTFLFSAITAGQAIRLSFLSISLPLIDIISSLIAIGLLSYFLFNKNLLVVIKEILKNNVWKFLLIFLFWAVISLLINSPRYSIKETVIAFSYWVRLLIVFFISSSIYYLSKTKEWGVKRIFNNSFILWSSVLLLFGFLQLIFLPDFSFMTYLGWDPHQGRMLSTFFDPNYFGVFIVLVMTFMIGFITKKDERKIMKGLAIFLTFLFWIALYLTYSRSAWLVGSIALPIAVWPKNWKITLVVFFVFASVLFIPNRLNDRFAVSGSIFSREVLNADISNGYDNNKVKDPSAAARGISMRRALELGKKNWLFGVGYNAYGVGLYKSGIVDKQFSGFASQGSDSSLLNVFATTGIIGLILFFVFLGYLGNALYKLWSKNLDGGYLFGFLIAWVLGSFFNNSVFYILILLPSMVLLSVVLKEDKQTKTHV